VRKIHMKTIQSTYLRYAFDNSDKVYLIMMEVDDDEYYLVKYGYGRFGSIPKVSYKAAPGNQTRMAQETAEKLYNKLLRTKTNKGYQLQKGTYSDALQKEGFNLDYVQLNEMLGGNTTTSLIKAGPVRKPKPVTKKRRESKLMLINLLSQQYLRKQKWTCFNISW